MSHRSMPSPWSPSDDPLAPSQVDPGWFYLIQDGLRVGELVSRQDAGDSNKYYEHWFLYTSGDGTTTAAYVRPSSSNTSVVTKLSYQSATANLQTIWSNVSNYATYEYGTVLKIANGPSGS